MGEANDLKILIADDSDRHIDKYASYFKKYFNEVFIAKDGMEAYEKYLESTPDIILLDINIPKLNGIELLKKIRGGNDLKTQVIILSAHSEKSFILEAMRSKASDYLIKPVTREELKDAINLALGQLRELKQ